MGKCCAGIWLMVQNVLWSWMRTALGMGNGVEEDDKDLADNRSLIWAQTPASLATQPRKLHCLCSLKFPSYKMGAKYLYSMSMGRLWWPSQLDFEIRYLVNHLRSSLLWTVNFSSLPWRPRLETWLSSWDSCCFSRSQFCSHMRWHTTA